MNETKSAFVAIVGRPNVGKSSILNAVTGVKLAIVSQKPQTTRTKITGICTRDDTQLIFLDTPGLHIPKTKLGEYMVKAVRDSVADVDFAILVAEAGESIAPAEQELMERFRQLGLPAILALNKIDLLTHKEEMMAQISAFTQTFAFASVVPLSAQNGDGVEILLEEAAKLAAPGPFFFDPDEVTDQPERVIAAEIVREKMLRLLSDEVPHGIAVSVESFKERENTPLLDIEVNIFCEKESHKGIIIGKHGAMLKKIGTMAREDMEAFFGMKVNLQCWVKVKEDWRNRAGLLRDFGYE